MVDDDISVLFEKVNVILRRADYSITSYTECSSIVFLDLYNHVTRSNIAFDASLGEIGKCEFIVSALEDYLAFSLPHIEGWCLATNQPEAVRDLLNVFLELWDRRGELQNALCHTPESSSLATTVSSNRHDFPSQSTPQSHSHSKSMDDDDAAIEYYALSEVTDSEESNGTLSSNSNIGPGGSEILPNLYLDYLEDLCATSENSTQEAPKHVYKDGDSHCVLHPLSDKFPLIYMSPSTSRVLHQKQRQHTKLLHSQARSLLPTTVSKKVEEVQRKHQGLQELLHKDLKHAVHVQKQKLECEQERGLKGMLHSNRMANARARKYFQEYELGLKNKLRVPRTSEEQTFIKTFEENMKRLQENTRARVKSIKERQADMEHKLCDHLDSVENYYTDQFAMMSESAEESKRVTKPFSKQINKCKKLKEMEHKVQELQDAIIQRRADVQHFREVDAAALKLPLNVDS